MTEGAIIMRAAERVCNVAMAITDHVWSGERLQGSKEKRGPPMQFGQFGGPVEWNVKHSNPFSGGYYLM
ncbi:hypothetical protein AB4Z25_26130 [Rhizobium sp. RAF36]|jgi:hypothetical protein|uniref:hypothetical protein n=1 Tax=Rhizobium sp. RAF36 TaxID=3233055 RepID=UPI003F99BF6E